MKLAVLEPEGLDGMEGVTGASGTEGSEGLDGQESPDGVAGSQQPGNGNLALYAAGALVPLAVGSAIIAKRRKLKRRKQQELDFTFDDLPGGKEGKA